jgi:small subunit ribosomal protein S18
LSQDEREDEAEAPVTAQEEPVAEARPEAGEPSAGQPAARPEAGGPSEGQPAAGPEATVPEQGQPGAEPVAARQEEGQPTARPARPERPRPAPGERRRRHFGRRKVCSFCVEKAQSIDYKDPVKLRRYLSDRGRIEARRKTGTCAKHQRWLATALKRARHLALLPYTPEHIRISGMFAARR